MKNKFENSKLRNKCCHGTDFPSFRELDKKQIQKDPEEGDAGYFGWGFYLTTDKEYASTFGDNILEFFVNIEKPFTFDLDDYSEVIDFIFKDSGKHLHQHIRDTMYALKLVGRDDSKTEFPNDNPRHLRKECLEIYDKYNEKDLTEGDIEEIKGLYIKLAKYLSNWLNGVFMYFGKELFHYFTSAGYDGIIAKDGQEVVVYETRQLQLIEEETIEPEEEPVEEDLDLVPAQVNKQDVLKMVKKAWEFAYSSDNVVIVDNYLFTFADGVLSNVYTVDDEGYVCGKPLWDLAISNEFDDLWDLGEFTWDSFDDGTIEKWLKENMNIFSSVFNDTDRVVNGPTFYLDWVAEFLWNDGGVWDCDDYEIQDIERDFPGVSFDDLLDEDLDLVPMDVTDWKAGGDEYTNKIRNYLRNNPDITDFNVPDLYPLRQNVVWLEKDGLNKFYIVYKGVLKLTFYIGGEFWIYPYDDDDNTYWSSEQDLEDNGIYTDDEYYAFTNGNDVGGCGGFDEHTLYIGMEFEPLINNPDGEIIYGYDLSYEDMYSLEEFIDTNTGSMQWIVETVLPAFINDDCPEYFEEDEDEEEEEESEEEPLDEEKHHKVKKHITREKILKDVISTFGCLSEDKLTDAVYLLPNGKILDTKGSNETPQHKNVAEYISDKYNYKDLKNDGSQFMDDIGAVRITPWIPAMIVTNIPLSEEQEDILYNILEKLQSKVSKDTPLMISISDGSQQIEYTQITNPEDIVTAILGYQIFGVLTEKLNPKKAEMLFLNRING